MKKDLKFTFYLGLYIIALCGLGMFMTFLNDYIQNSGFFGDSIFVRYHDKYGDFIGDGMLDKGHVWGARHYWYWWMCFLLFCLSIIRVIIWIVYYYDNSEKSKP